MKSGAFAEDIYEGQFPEITEDLVCIILGKGLLQAKWSSRAPGVRLKYHMFYPWRAFFTVRSRKKYIIFSFMSNAAEKETFWNSLGETNGGKRKGSSRGNEMTLQLTNQKQAEKVAAHLADYVNKT